MTHDRGGGLPGLLGLRFRWRSREGELELEGFFNFFLSTIGTSVPERSARWVMLCGRLGRIRMASGRSSLVLETSIKRCDVRASRAGFRPVLGLTKPRAGGLLTVDLRRSAGYRDKSPGRCSPRDTGRPGGLDGGRTAGQFRRNEHVSGDRPWETAWSCAGNLWRDVFISAVLGAGRKRIGAAGALDGRGVGTASDEGSKRACSLCWTV